METNAISAAPLKQDKSLDSLPVSALLALAMTGFLALMTETFPAGLLPQISRDLAVSESLAGQLVTLYAIGSLISAIPLTAATRGWSRRPLLLSALAGFFIFNIITAYSSNYILTLVVRFLAGMSGGLIWGMLAGYAWRMVSDRLKGRAMALAMVGAPLALSFGVPGGTYLGTLVGWQNTFLIMSALTLVLIVWVIISVPNYPGQDAQQQIPIRKVFLLPGVRSVLAVVVAWILAHSVLYTYIAPFLIKSGLSGSVDKVLLVFGLFAMAGIWLTGILVDRMLRKLVLINLFFFGAAAIVLGIAGNNGIAVMLAIGLWGLTFGSAATLLQTASADAAGNEADVAQSMIVTAWNIAIAAGGIIGGILLDTVGTGSFPWASFILIVIGLLITIASRKYGFKPGPRNGK